MTPIHENCGGILVIPRYEIRIEGKRITASCGKWRFCNKCESMVLVEIKIIVTQEVPKN